MHSKIKTLFEDDWTDSGEAEAFAYLFGDVFFVKDDRRYFWNGTYWKSEDTNPKKSPQLHLAISGQFYRKVRKSLCRYLESNDVSVKKARELWSKCLALQNVTHKNSLVPEIDRHVTKDIELNTNLDLFVFENGVYDLQNGEWVEPNPEDYMTMSCGYDYVKPTKKQLKKVLKVLGEIFPIEEERQAYLRILGTALSGRQLDRFVLANQKGGNGKSFLHEFVLKTIGPYGYKGNNCVIQQPPKTGSNPEVANMGYKRFVLFSEPEETGKLVASTITDITGFKEVNARMNYSNATKTILHNTTICECNKKPVFDKTDDAVLRRLLDFLFRSFFVAKEDMDMYEGMPHVYPKDESMKDDGFYREHRTALFHVLVSGFQEYLKIGVAPPKSIKERGKEYLAECDDFLSWFREAYTKTDNEEDFVQLREVFDNFKLSELWNNLPKAEKRVRNYRFVCREVEYSPHLRKSYRERHYFTQEGKQQERRRVLVGWKPNEEDEEEDDFLVDD